MKCAKMQINELTRCFAMQGTCQSSSNASLSALMNHSLIFTVASLKLHLLYTQLLSLLLSRSLSLSAFAKFLINCFTSQWHANCLRSSAFGVTL